MSLRRCRLGAIRLGLALALIACAPWPCGLLVPGRAVLVQESDPNALYGIGAVLVIQNAAATVAELAPGGAADKNGQLKPGDVITGVAQADGPFVDCAALPLDKVVAMVRGKRGTTVRLRVISGGVPKVVSLVRAEIKLAAMGQGQQGVPMQIAGAVINIRAGAVRVFSPRSSIVDITPKDPLKSLAPGDAALLADFLKSAAGEVRKKQAVQMSKKVNEVVAATGLDDTGKKVLAGAVPLALDQLMPKTESSISDLIRGEFELVPAGQLHQVLEQASAMMPMVAQAYEQQTDVWPDDAPAWQTALKKALSPAQAAAWAAADAKHHQEIESQITDHLAVLANNASNLARNQIQPEADSIRSTLNLAPDRLAKLNALVSSAADDFGKSVRTRSEKALLEMPDDDRTVAMKVNGFDFPPTGAMDEWRTGVAKILTPEELNGLKSAKEDRAAARAQALGRVLLALMDERVALTSAQRAQLEPFTADLVNTSPEITAEADSNAYYGISLSQLLATGNGADQDQIKAILDTNQWQHWQDAAAGKNLSENIYEEQNLQLPAAGGSGTPAPQPVAEPDTVDKAISKYMTDKSKTERQKVFAEKLLKAEDAARILHLPEDAAQHLKTAACGAADAFMTGWNNSAEQTVRANLGTITADTVEQRLQCIQGYQLEQAESNATTGTPQDNVWDQTVKTVLDQGQMRAWKAETDAREKYENDAIGGWITVSFAQRFALSPDQADKLKPIVTKILKKYADRFQNYFQNDSPWYLESYSMFTPFVGIEDHEMSAILTKDQIDHMKGNPVYGQASMYWQNISR